MSSRANRAAMPPQQIVGTELKRLVAKILNRASAIGMKKEAVNALRANTAWINMLGSNKPANRYAAVRKLYTKNIERVNQANSLRNLVKYHQIVFPPGKGPGSVATTIKRNGNATTALQKARNDGDILDMLLRPTAPGTSERKNRVGGVRPGYFNYAMGPKYNTSGQPVPGSTLNPVRYAVVNNKKKVHAFALLRNYGANVRYLNLVASFKGHVSGLLKKIIENAKTNQKKHLNLSAVVQNKWKNRPGNNGLVHMYKRFDFKPWNANPTAASVHNGTLPMFLNLRNGPGPHPNFNKPQHVLDLENATKAAHKETQIMAAAQAADRLARRKAKDEERRVAREQARLQAQASRTARTVAARTANGAATMAASSSMRSSTRLRRPSVR